MRVHYAVHRVAECIGVETLFTAWQPAAVDNPDEPRQVIVGAGVMVVLVALEPVGALVVGPEVLSSAVISVGADAVFQSRASDVPAIGLVEVTPVIRTEVILQESLVNLLNNGEQAIVGSVECELRVGMPRRWQTRIAEKTPGKRLPHLGWIIVHRLEIDARHSGKMIGAVGGMLEGNLPRPLRGMQGPVAAIRQREIRRAERHAFGAWAGNMASVGRVGPPHI